MIERLIDALKDGLGDIPVQVTVPATLTPGTVVVAPGDPFLVPGNHGSITERWDVLVVTSSAGPDRGVNWLRETSLLVRKAASSVGAVWSQALGPSRATPNENDMTVLVVNQISFRYDPNELENP